VYADIHKQTATLSLANTHNSLVMHVELTEDNRYLCAGVQRGSTEMLVADLSTLHTQGSPPSRKVGMKEFSCIAVRHWC
jgi:hypothetical protein